MSENKKRKSNPVWLRAHALAVMWEVKYEERMIITGRELKWVKDVKDVPLDELERRFAIYLNDEWYEGCRHSIPAFIANINKFIPLKKREPEMRPGSSGPLMISCSDCGAVHDSNVLCPVCYREEHEGGNAWKEK